MNVAHPSPPTMAGLGSAGACLGGPLAPRPGLRKSPQPRERVHHPEKGYTTPGFEVKSTKSPEKVSLAPRKCEKVTISPEKVSPSKSTLFRGNFAPEKGALAPENSISFFCPGKGVSVVIFRLSNQKLVCTSQ